MKILYLDIFSGISGDMFLGALLDLGLDAKQLEYGLATLRLDGYHLHISRQHKASIEGIKFDVHLGDHGHADSGTQSETRHSHGPNAHHHSHESEQGHGHDHAHGHADPWAAPAHGHSDHVHHDEASHSHEHAHGRNFSEIRELIQKSALSNWVKEKAVAVFHRVAVAEGKIHGHPPDQVHFHEVGAVDSIIDIVGACIGLELLGKPRVWASPVIEGTGWVDCAHGRFPVPTTATLEILGARQIAVTQCDEPHELVTPTGAALLAEFVECFAPMSGLVASRVGYGLGTRDNKTRPNVLRAVLGEIREETTAGGPIAADAASADRGWELDQVVLIETNLDDINAEILGDFVERALSRGALDVFYTAIQMKKNRPGVLLSVLSTPEQADEFAEMILRETTAFGVRRSTLERRKLRCEFKSVTTPFGEVTLKLGKLGDRIVQASPEYESCRKAAETAKVSVKEVFGAAARAAADLPRHD